MPDPVGTVGLQIDVSTGVVTRRWTDPFGNSRGDAVAWPSPLGFLNAPESAVGLTQLGARAYDSVLGVFVSVDPLLDTSEPRHANAYGYAMHSPVSYSDADGLRPIIQPPPGGGSPYSPAPRPAPSSPGGHWNPSPPSAGNDPAGDTGSVGPAQEQFWNPMSWSDDTWRGIGAVASGIAVSVGIGLAAVGGGACVLVTAGVCAVVIAGVAGAAGAVVTYNLATDPDERTAEGLLSTAALGAAAGAAGGVAGTLISKALSGTAAVASSVRYGPIKPGPLDEAVANTFRSGSYTGVIADKPTTLYRVFSGNKELGSYWTRTKPSGPVQSIVDSALDPAWGNQAVSWVKVRVPAGTTFYEGAAASQGGLVGGGNQVFVPRVDPSWVVGRGGF
nr:RHS repeat-associated core domain-containing protein [Microbacterium pseudoresistens]